VCLEFGLLEKGIEKEAHLFHSNSQRELMIEWGGLAANSLWILGCALALATLSFAGWWSGFLRQI
jgi:hypothetical protein